MSESLLQRPFFIEVFTPEGLILEGETTEVRLPSSAGEIAVRPAHRNYVGLLGTGILRFECQASSRIKRAAIAGGFCRFEDNKLVVMANAADLPESVDQENYAAERSELQKLIGTGHFDDPEQVLARRKLERIEAIDSLISH